MDAKLLESASLTRNESIVYLTLLQIGMSKTGAILKESKLNSGKIYEILNSLMEKGLASKTAINNVKHFSAAPPNKLLEYIKEKKEILNKNEREIQSIIPQLEGLRKTKLEKTNAVVYQGFKGFKTAANEIFAEENNGFDHMAMGVTKTKPKKYSDYWLKKNRKMSEVTLRRRILFSEESCYEQETSKIKNVKVRVLNNITPAAIDIVNNTVLILNYEGEGTFVLIENENIAKSFTSFFNQLWKVAKD